MAYKKVPCPACSARGRSHWIENNEVKNCQQCAYGGAGFGYILVVDHEAEQRERKAAEAKRLKKLQDKANAKARKDAQNTQGKSTPDQSMDLRFLAIGFFATFLYIHFGVGMDLLSAGLLGVIAGVLFGVYYKAILLVGFIGGIALLYYFKS